MMNPLAMKLEQFTKLDNEDRARLDGWAGHRQKTWAARTDIISEGDHVDHIHLVLSGLAARYKLLPNGERQIMAFLVPGDLCDLEVFILDEMDHGICATSDVKCALIHKDKVEEMLTESSNLTKALWWSTMTDSAVLRERIVDHGRRDARERLAHLLYEMLIRYRIVGLTQDDAFEFPVTQEELADASGMTPVHVNRTLKQLRDEGVVDFRGKIVKIIDPSRVRELAQFNANYLHLQRSAGRVGEAAKRAEDLL
jgi:CRP-like cAMP-binding protein